MSDERPRSRRSILKLLGAATLGAAGSALGRTDRAAAADGSSLVLGQDNTSTAKTSITNNGAISNDGAFVVDATAADWALEGSSGNLGVVGNGFIGVVGSGDLGGSFTGNLAALHLEPQAAAGAPTSGDFSVGDLLVDANGALYICTGAGNPGTWSTIGGGGIQLLPAAVRLYDSRSDPRGAFGQGEERTVAVAGNQGIPANAIGLVGNVAVTGTSASGNALVYPTGVSRPNAASINWFGEGQTLNNALTAKIGASGSVTLYAAMPTHLILDATGYLA